MNNWNRSTSYANNVKVYALGLEVKISEKMLEMMENSLTYFIKVFRKTYGETLANYYKNRILWH